MNTQNKPTDEEIVTEVLSHNYEYLKVDCDFCEYSKDVKDWEELLSYIDVPCPNCGKGALTSAEDIKGLVLQIYKLMQKRKRKEIPAGIYDVTAKKGGIKRNEK